MFDLIILFLGIYPTDILTQDSNDICARIFITLLFIKVKGAHQLRTCFSFIF